MTATTLILHGWSDSSASFEHVRAFLGDHGPGPVENIYFGDYDSREDHLTFHDTADGLHSEMIKRGFVAPDGTKNVDLNVIVHSTGGLVIRHWIWRYYIKNGRRIEECPINRLVMLAPANFGSPLAHRGKSFFGKLLKGKWDFDDMLEVGKNLLAGLELASPYQWWLAHRDLFQSKAPYRPDEIQTTVLVGSSDYEGLIGSYTNKPGTDGTVVVSGTPLHSLKLSMNCCPPKHRTDAESPIHWRTETTNVQHAFAVLPGLNHTTIKQQIGDGGILDELILEALLTENEDEFRSFRKECFEVTKNTFKKEENHRYQQFHLHAIDDQDQPVTDFSVEFRIVKASKIKDGVVRNVRRSALENEHSARIHEKMADHFHTHSRDASYRRFLIDYREIKTLIEEARTEIGEEVGLAMCLHLPDVDEGITYETENLRDIVIYRTDRKPTNRPSFLFPGTTTLVELRVNRETDLVEINQAPAGR